MLAPWLHVSSLQNGAYQRMGSVTCSLPLGLVFWYSSQNQDKGLGVDFTMCLKNPHWTSILGRFHRVNAEDKASLWRPQSGDGNSLMIQRPSVSPETQLCLGTLHPMSNSMFPLGRCYPALQWLQRLGDLVGLANTAAVTRIPVYLAPRPR